MYFVTSVAAVNIIFVMAAWGFRLQTPRPRARVADSPVRKCSMDWVAPERSSLARTFSVRSQSVSKTASTRARGNGAILFGV